MAKQPIPEARGFAAALETYLARGGGRRKSGASRKGGFRYTEGPMRGQTTEQATAAARRLWDRAPDSVKEKYAAMESRTLAPSEAAAAGYAGPDGIRVATPGDTNGDGILDAYQQGGGSVPARQNPVPGVGSPANGQPDAAAGKSVSHVVEPGMDPSQAGFVGTAADRAFAARIATGAGGGEYGETAFVSPGMMNYTFGPNGLSATVGTASTDARPNPGVVPAANPAGSSEVADYVRQPAPTARPGGPTDVKVKAPGTGKSPDSARFSADVETAAPEQAPVGKVWIGMKGGKRIYADGDPAKNGAAPPAGYDPRGGSAYAGPDAPAIGNVAKFGPAEAPAPKVKPVVEAPGGPIKKFTDWSGVGLADQDKVNRQMFGDAAADEYLKRQGGSRRQYTVKR